MNGMINEWWILNMYWKTNNNERDLLDYWDQKTLQMGGMWWHSCRGNVGNFRIKHENKQLKGKDLITFWGLKTFQM